jgi:hypothetical protein
MPDPTSEVKAIQEKVRAMVDRLTAAGLPVDRAAIETGIVKDHIAEQLRTQSVPTLPSAERDVGKEKLEKEKLLRDFIDKYSIDVSKPNEVKVRIPSTLTADDFLKDAECVTGKVHGGVCINRNHWNKWREEKDSSGEVMLKKTGLLPIHLVGWVEGTTKKTRPQQAQICHHATKVDAIVGWAAYKAVTNNDLFRGDNVRTKTSTLAFVSGFGLFERTQGSEVTDKTKGAQLAAVAQWSADPPEPRPGILGRFFGFGR